MLLRLFPVGRGIFEDKVSNVWCAVNVFVKLRKLYPADTLLFVCAVTTGALSLPSNILLFLKPTRQNFLLALINTSLVFFMFSFQVNGHAVSQEIPNTVASLQSNSYMKSVIESWSSAMRVTSTRASKSCNVHKMDRGQIACQLVWATEINFYDADLELQVHIMILLFPNNK